MTSSGRRMDGLYDRLTARERALLVLQSWKEGKDEDPEWRWTMPADQHAEFNRLIELMNGVNQHLSPFVFATGLEVDKLSLRLGWLSTMTLWQHQSFELHDFLLGPKGVHLEGIQLEKGAKARLRKALAFAPAVPTVHLAEEFKELVAKEARKPNRFDEVVAVHKDVLREAIPGLWAQLRAADIVIAEVAPDFDGEDPARPELRQIIDHSLQRLMDDLRKQAELYVGPLELAEPSDELLEKLRRVVRLEADAG